MVRKRNNRYRNVMRNALVHQTSRRVTGTSDGGFTADNFGVLLNRSAKPVYLLMRYAAVSEAVPFQVVVRGAANAGSILYRSQQIIASLGGGTMRIRLPPSTDFGDYTGNAEIVTVRTSSAIQISLHLEVLYSTQTLPI